MAWSWPRGITAGELRRCVQLLSLAAEPVIGNRRQLAYASHLMLHRWTCDWVSPTGWTARTVVAACLSIADTMCYVRFIWLWRAADGVGGWQCKQDSMEEDLDQPGMSLWFQRYCWKHWSWGKTWIRKTNRFEGWIFNQERWKTRGGKFQYEYMNYSLICSLENEQGLYTSFC